MFALVGIYDYNSFIIFWAKIISQ